MAHDEGFSYEIRGDLVHVTRKPTRAQARHLVKKAVAAKKKPGR